MKNFTRRIRLLVPYYLRALYFTFKYRRQISDLQIAECGIKSTQHFRAKAPQSL